MGYYDPYSNPYQNANSTGVAKLLAQQAEQDRLMSESRRLDRILQETSELRYRVDQLDRHMSPQVSMRPIMFEDIDDVPEPSVEHSEPSTFWRDLFADPFFEIFKRPSIKYH